jgi:hypothetical protein
MPEDRECPPPMLKTSMVGPLGGDVGGPGVPTTYAEGINGGALRGDAGGPGEPTTYAEDVDGWPLGGEAENPRAPTTYCKDIAWQAPWGSGLHPWSEGVL